MLECRVVREDHIALSRTTSVLLKFATPVFALTQARRLRSGRMVSPKEPHKRRCSLQRAASKQHRIAECFYKNRRVNRSVYTAVGKQNRLLNQTHLAVKPLKCL